MLKKRGLAIKENEKRQISIKYSKCFIERRKGINHIKESRRKTNDKLTDDKDATK